MLMQIFGGATKSIMVFFKKGYKCTKKQDILFHLPFIEW